MERAVRSKKHHGNVYVLVLSILFLKFLYEEYGKLRSTSAAPDDDGSRVKYCVFCHCDVPLPCEHDVGYIKHPSNNFVFSLLLYRPFLFTETARRRRYGALWATGSHECNRAADLYMYSQSLCSMSVWNMW
jgi:hypothetical protein